ncbi:hypothetical protein Taro_053639 [Colocasia esculenta]|uniref:BHLH domain-containing protein n=1 Tax=Colocasia esculenta TaxID=4460 RepID=A0A843XLP7_COLES|nr:hypothetical protein [Colocasia esculenta]
MGSPGGLEAQLLGSMSQFAAEEFASLRLPTSLAEMDTAACMGFVDGAFSSELNAGDNMDNPGLGLMGFSGNGFLCQHLDLLPLAAYMEALPPGFLPVECPAAVPAPPTASVREESQKQANNKRRRAAAPPDGASADSTPIPVSGSNISGEEKPKKKDSTSRKVKRGRCSSGKEEEIMPKEVVHVRARRGQATDSHSLAERVRREKINEKMRCLQDLVPGCYKAMGMAVMLDEIINYVQSLQNQVEFLSMKLSAASAVYDFNQELDSSVVMPQSLTRVGEANEAQEVDRLMREGLERCTSFHPTMPF